VKKRTQFAISPAPITRIAKQTQFVLGRLTTLNNPSMSFRMSWPAQAVRVSAAIIQLAKNADAPVLHDQF
jgi:hypothetical protein